MNQSTKIIVTIWVGLLLLSIIALVILLIWALKTGQLSNQKHAARLPLQSGIPDEENEGANTVQKEGETGEEKDARL